MCIICIGPIFKFSSFLHFYISSSHHFIILYSFPTIMSALSLLYRGCFGPDRVKNDVLCRDCVSNRTPLCSFWPLTSQLKLGLRVIFLLHPCVCFFIIYYFSGGLPISNDPSWSIYSYRARQPPFLTSVTSIFGRNGSCMYIFIYYIYYIYFIYVLVSPWFYLVLGQSLGFFTHNSWRFGLFSQFAKKTLTV